MAVEMFSDRMRLNIRANGVSTYTENLSAGSVKDTWFDVYVECGTQG